MYRRPTLWTTPNRSCSDRIARLADVNTALLDTFRPLTDLFLQPADVWRHVNGEYEYVNALTRVSHN